MIKHNFRKFKRQHFLSHVPRAQNYKYWSSKDEFDDEVKIVKIMPDEWVNAVNLMQNDHQAKLPIWLQRLKGKTVLPFINELDMVLVEYKTTMIQTTYFPWGRKDIHIEDHWTFRNADGFELCTDWWYLASETSFRLSHESTQHTSVFLNIINKKIKKQVERTLLAIKMITNVVDVSSIKDILDKFSHEQIRIELISDSTQYENNQLIYAEYDVLYDKHKYFLRLDFKEKYYLLGEDSSFYDYLSFDINCVSKYSLKEMYKLILDK